jgi:hypothetical protein
MERVLSRSGRQQDFPRKLRLEKRDLRTSGRRLSPRVYDPLAASHEDGFQSVSDCVEREVRDAEQPLRRIQDMHGQDPYVKPSCPLPLCGSRCVPVCPPISFATAKTQNNQAARCYEQVTGTATTYQDRAPARRWTADHTFGRADMTGDPVYRTVLGRRR